MNKGLVIIIICFLAQGLHSQNDIEFRNYADTVEQKIKNESLFVQDYLDTLASISMKNKAFSKGVISMLNGSWARAQGELDNAFEYYKEAVEILVNCCAQDEKAIQAKLGLHRVYLVSGLYNFDTSYFQKGMSLVRSAFKDASAIKDSSLMAMSYNSLGDYQYYSAFQIQNMDSAYHYYSQSLAMTKSSDTYKLADNYLGLANVYRNMDNVKLEQEYFNKAYSVADSLDYFDVVYALYNDKAEWFENSGDYKQALALKKKAYDYVVKTGDKEFINRADRQLYYTYKNLGDYKLALSYYERYHDSIESMHKAEALKLQNELEVKQQINTRELKISQLENDQYKSQVRFLIVLAILVLVILLAMAWINRNLRQTNKRLEQKNKEIMLARLRGQNSERKRMAGELHDNLNTKIAAVMWQLEALKSKLSSDNAQFLDNSINQLKDTYEDVRLISHNLMPEAVESIGLIRAISDLLQKLNESDKVNFKLVTELAEDESFGDISYAVYNIIFEMINNILKHSQAQKAWINLSKNDKGDLDITVGDDGLGFEVDQMSDGYGIKNIISRVDNLNGQWNIDSAPGKGTKIYISIPNI